MENFQRYVGQVAIVTGGASGIGAAIAARLATEGAKVVLFDNNESGLSEQMDKMKFSTLNVSQAVVDITKEKQVRKAFREVVETHERLDVVVNSAGIVGPTSTNIADYTLSSFKQVLAINLTGSFLITKYAIENMLPRNYGRILLIASIGGKEGNPGMVGYATSKSGVMGLVKSIGKEYAETGITVNGIAPAVIATPMNVDTDPRMMEYMLDKIPMKRLGLVDEVAALVCWICSKEASFNTGFVFDLSGGRATY
ncbi:MAG: SDR family oxidoreductase [Anaerolineales bacterium]|nr:SDR family oxidoreductase [Anaerolineales bacterium]